MKEFKIIMITVLSGFFLQACEGSESSASTNETDETADTVITETEVVSQIVEDLDNATFELRLQEKGGVLIDLRTPEEVQEGSIEGSVNIDFNAGELTAAMDTLDPTVPIFVYCQGGGRSGQARDLLKEKGFLEIYNLREGYGNWEK